MSESKKRIPRRTFLKGAAALTTAGAHWRVMETARADRPAALAAGQSRLGIRMCLALHDDAGPSGLPSAYHAGPSA